MVQLKLAVYACYYHVTLAEGHALDDHKGHALDDSLEVTS